MLNTPVIYCFFPSRQNTDCLSEHICNSGDVQYLNCEPSMTKPRFTFIYIPTARKSRFTKDCIKIVVDISYKCKEMYKAIQVQIVHMFNVVTGN